jgi:hypothetical protein
MGLVRSPRAGLWRLTIHGPELDFILSSPEGPDAGDYTVEITGAGDARLAPGPGCEIRPNAKRRRTSASGCVARCSR